MDASSPGKTLQIACLRCGADDFVLRQIIPQMRVNTCRRAEGSEYIHSPMRINIISLCACTESTTITTGFMAKSKMEAAIALHLARRNIERTRVLLYTYEGERNTHVKAKTWRQSKNSTLLFLYLPCLAPENKKNRSNTQPIHGPSRLSRRLSVCNA